jgi:hypothetical protein
VIETEWVTAKCQVMDVSWKSDLYDIYLIRNDSATKNNDTTIVAFETMNVNDTIMNEDDTNSSISVKLQVKGWLYAVKVQYKNMLFSSAIRDPSETEMIPPLYAKGSVHECLCMVEKLKSEVALQKDVYERYLAYMKRLQEKEGKSFLEYIYDEDAVDENIFFVMATTWPKIDAFTEDHEMEKKIKIVLVVASFGALLVGLVLLKIFYSHYVDDAFPSHVHVNRI